MQFRIIAFLLLLSGGALAQKKDTLLRYFNEELEPVKRKQAVFAGIAIKDPLGWSVIIYNEKRKPIMRGKYQDPDCTVKNGWFLYYNEEGQRYLAGKYTNNLKNDIWRTWYPSGQLKDSTHFIDDLAHGYSFRYFESGLLEAKTHFTKGVQDSTGEWYHENGQRATIEIYKDGKLSSLTCFDSTGLNMGINCAIYRAPAIKGKYGGVEKYITDSLKLPAIYFADDFRRVNVQFTINRHGLMTEPSILYSQDSTISSEIIKTLMSVPGWYPAVLHNRNVDHTYTLSVSLLPFGQGIAVKSIVNPYQLNN